MHQSDLLVILASGELRVFAELALEHASVQHKPIVPVLVGKASEPPKQFQHLHYVRLKSREQASAIVDLIAARAKDNSTKVKQPQAVENLSNLLRRGTLFFVSERGRTLSGLACGTPATRASRH
jgi:hypothetical protein